MSSSGGQQWWVAVALAMTASALPPVASPVTTSATVQALRVWHSWDEARAEAWAAGDVRALRALYAPGAGRADLRLLGRYLGRGLRVERLRTQIFSAAVLRARPGRFRLRMVDRLAGGDACGHGRCLPLPRDHASERTVSLVRRDGRWVVTDVH